jgi:sugar/nucleoside kinase (ribokinase family)
MSIDDEREALRRQLDYLASRLPTDEELAYLRNRIEADENAAWAWKTIKTHAPWIATLISTLGAGMYWLMTHTISISGPK